MRQRRPDGSVWVRTHPLTCVHDSTSPAHDDEWDQLTYAASGVMHVHAETASWLVRRTAPCGEPFDWLTPAGLRI